MIPINTKMNFVDLGLRTKKFFFYVVYDQFGYVIYDICHI